jgi:site-specific DNA-cytosine methylase
MAKGLTDAQLDAMDEMEARQNLYGTAARVLEAPDAVPMTDAQMDQRATSDSVMQATSFGQKTMPQSAPQPPQADFREPAKPLTDAELNAQEDNLYYDPAYEMPFEEFAPVHARRQQEKNTVGSFVDGAVAAGQGLVSLTAEMGGELRDNFTSNIFRPDRFATQNFVTLKEGGRKAGLEFAKFIDWVGNTARDHATDVRRQEQVRGAIAQKLQAEGKLSGDLRGDLEIINREFAAAKERGETAPTPLEENADVEQAFEDYRRGKNFDREIAGVGNYNIGQTPVTQESSEARATNPITGEVMEPQRALATGASLAMAPDNLLPVGAGVMSKARILRRLSSITGVPLKMTENVANAGADALQRGAMRITDRVQDLTGMNAMQQTAAATALTGGVGYLSTQGEGAPAALGGVATGVLSILPIMKFGGAILRRTGAAAGGSYAIVREMGAGGAGVAGAEAADAMAKSGAFPQRYARHMQPGGASADSTLRRVAQDPENPQMLRRLSRTANNLGATQAFRLADDAVSSAAVSGLAAAPFALVAPDAEQGGQIVGGAVLLGTTIGTATRSFGRRPAEVDADIARMLVDVTESNGDAASLMSLSHDSLSQLAAMQGVLRNKVKLIPLRGQDYRANADLRAAGGETAAGLYVEKDANGSARIFVNMGHTAPVDGTVSVRPDADKGGSVIDITAADGTVDSTHVPQGIRLLVKTGDTVSANQRLAQDLSPNRIIPHEIGHAILTSDILDGQPRNDLRNLVNQQYATDGVAARGREYATRLVDKDILVGAIEDAPVNLTDAQINDISSGKTTLADVMKGQPVSEQARQRLIDQRVEELSERSVENGQDPLDWARDEIIAETFASEAPAIDFRAIRRDAMFPRLAESILASGGRVLEVMGARLDPGTGKLLDNPSVLFRDNPLFQDRIMQKRVKEYVRAYDQYLVGLEEAGTAAPRGVELARSNRPEDLGRSTHVKLRDEGRGVLENDFLFQRPDGTYSFKPQKLVNQAEASRAAQIKTLYDAKKFVPVNSTEFGKRKVNGREVIGGPVLPPQFDFFTHFPQHVREFARSMEQSRAEGGSWDIDYNAIGTGSSGRYRVTNLGNVRAIQRETVPFGWQVTKANHLLAASLDLNAFRASSMKAINRGDLGLFNNDMKQVEADLKAYLANHRAGLPGEATIGIAKRDMLNGLIGTGTAVQRTANPLYYELNPRGSIRTWRVDRLNDARPTGRTGYFFDYDKINNNRMPQQIPRGAQGMPDAAASGRGQAMPDITITPDEARRQGLVGPVYHGSPDFKGRKFDPKYRARSSGLSRGGFSFTEDVASADGYAGAGVDSAQAAVDAANDVMRDLGTRMEAGLKLREFADVSEVPEFNVRYADDMDGLASYFNDLSKRIPKDLGARLRDAARAINEPANPVVVEAYLRNPKEMMIDGKKLLVADNPDDIFVSAARTPQDTPSAAPRGQAMPDGSMASREAVVTQDGFVQAPEDAPTFTLPRRAMAQFMPDSNIRLEDYADRPIVALPADRMGIGQMRVGPKGSEQILSVPGQGGAGFMEIYNGGGWAFTDTATADRFLGRLREVARPGDTSVIVGITALNEVNHLKNQTGQLAYVEALEAAIKNKSVSRKQADAHIREIAKRIYTSEASPKALGQSTRDKFKAMRSFDDFQKAVRAKSLNFADAAWLLEKMQQRTLPLPYKDAQAIGIAFDDVARQTADPRYAGVPFGTVVALLEVPINQAPSKNPFHYAYPAKVEGNRIGFLSKFENIDDLTSDPRIRNKQGRVTAQPLQTVLPVMDRIGQPARAQFMPDVADISTSTSVAALQKHPMFKSAKYDGSAKAAFDIVESLVKAKAIQDVISKIDPSRPAYIIPVIAREGESANMLPLAMADKLSEATGVPIWNKLAKTSSQHNTGAKADARARTMHRWEGEPPPAGSQIVLVDDTYTTGQTLRSLAAVVGDPDAVATISVGRYTKQFTLQPDREQKLLAKAGLTKQQFINLYGSEPKQALTGAQAQQYLLNGARGEQGLLARFPVERGGFSTQGIAGLTQLPEGVTTFSGGGLVEIGLRGIVRPTVAVEYSPAIAQAYRAAHGDHVKVQDIRTVSLEDHKGKFHYHASPVCKNSSLLKSAALGGGEKDLDIESAQAVARHIDQIEPRVVTIENVPDYAKTEAADIIRKKLQERGYTMDENVYNAAKFGAPTARRRYLLRAVKDGVLPEPVPQDGPGWYSTVADMIETLPDDSIARAQYIYRSLREQGVDPDNVTEPLLVSGTTLFKKVAFARPDQPAFTFKATPATVDRILLPGGRVKRVTARAKARMTGIPDDYPLPNDEKTALTIIGNGVPPALVRNVFGPVIEANK